MQVSLDSEGGRDLGGGGVDVQTFTFIYFKVYHNRLKCLLIFLSKKEQIPLYYNKKQLKIKEKRNKFI